MRARFVHGLLFALASVSFGCSSSSDNNGGSDSGHDSATSDAQDSGGIDTNIDTGPQGCWIGHPTDSSAVTCDSCSFDKCKSQWQAAYGANYLSDDFTGGACKDDATCNCACKETDKICQEGCDISETTACHDAKAAIDACEKINCTTICGFDVIDSGADGDAPSEGGGD